MLTHRCCHGEIKRGELCLLAQSTTPRRIQVVFSHSTDPTPTPTFECCIRVRRVIFYSSNLSSVRQRNIYNIKWLRYVWSAHTLNRRSCCEMNAVDLWSPWTGSLPNRKDRLFWPSSGSKWVPQFKNFQFIFFFGDCCCVVFIFRSAGWSEFYWLVDQKSPKNLCGLIKVTETVKIGNIPLRS